jgi:amino acid adenylation domain-containing protein
VNASQFSHIEFPSELRPAPGRPFRGASHAFSFSSSLTKALISFGAARNATLFHTALAGISALLHRYTKHVRHSGRVAVASALGRLAERSLVLALEVSDNPPFGCLVERSRDTVVGARADEVSYEAIVAQLTPAEVKTYLRVGFVLTDKVDPLQLERWAGRFDLSFCCEAREDKLVGSVVYNSNVFGAQAVPQLVLHLTTLLEDAIARPEEPIGLLRLLPEEEDARVRFEPAVSSPKIQRRCLHELIEDQVARTPDSTALIVRDERLTYEQLNATANQFARHLIEVGVRPDSLVGVSLPRSKQLVPAILGVLKAGGAYVPLDPDYPKDRLAVMAEDANIQFMLTDTRSLAALPPNIAHVVLIDRDGPAIAKQPTDNPRSGATTENTAYVMYTSGSTGKPRGVVITHGNLGHHIPSLAARLEMSDRDTSILVASISFSASIRQYLAPLCVGASVVVAMTEELHDPIALLASVKRNNVSLLHVVPSHLRTITNALGQLEPSARADLLNNGLRMVLTASETLSSDVAAGWLSLGHGSTLMNMYGLTETTGVFMFCPVAKADLGGAPPIGRPMANAEVRLLDDQQQLVPIGIPGELFLAGPLLGRGYWKDHEATSAKFITTTDGRGKLLFRTGDRARIRADGNLELLGRIDDEVKIRGSKVIPEGVRRALAQHPGISDVAVVARDGPSGERRLVAFVVPKADATPLRSAELRRFARERLPEYMVPSLFLKLDALPMLPNGKVDRRSLPSIELGVPLLESEFVEPSTPAELALAEIWSHVLHMDHVGATDDFFELGGDSLKVMEVLVNVRVTFSIELDIIQIFAHPTISELARFITALGGDAATASLVPPAMPSGIPSKA